MPLRLRTDLLDDALSQLGAERPLMSKKPIPYWLLSVNWKYKWREDTLQHYQCSLACNPVSPSKFGTLMISYNHIGFLCQDEDLFFSSDLAKVKKICVMRPEVLCITFVRGGYWIISDLSDLETAQVFLNSLFQIHGSTWGSKEPTRHRLPWLC